MAMLLPSPESSNENWCNLHHRFTYEQYKDGNLEWSFSGNIGMVYKEKGFFTPPPQKKKFLIKTGRCNFCYCKIPPRCPENIPHKPFIISYIQIRKILRKNILENSYNYNKHVNLMQTSENVTTG